MDLAGRAAKQPEHFAPCHQQPAPENEIDDVQHLNILKALQSDFFILTLHLHQDHLGQRTDNEQAGADQDLSGGR